MPLPRPNKTYIAQRGDSQRKATHAGREALSTILTKSGNTYSCFMELESPDRIKMRGFIGLALIGQTEYWSRVK